jgi:hypothetical protein
MSMWFFDDAWEWQEYQAVREEGRRLEREYLEIRVVLQEAEAALREKPEDEFLSARVRYYQKRLHDLEAKNPRLAEDCPLEVSLFLPPHG